MSTKRIASTNSLILYSIGTVVLIIAFLLLGGGQVIKSMMHSALSINLADWNWPLILVGAGFCFLLGLLFAKWRW